MSLTPIKSIVAERTGVLKVRRSDYFSKLQNARMASHNAKMKANGSYVDRDEVHAKVIASMPADAAARPPVSAKAELIRTAQTVRSMLTETIVDAGKYDAEADRHALEEALTALDRARSALLDLQRQAAARRMAEFTQQL